jgi:curved DNA-binding protein CbpA
MSSPATGSIEPAPPAPDSLSPELQARWSEVAKRALEIERENYYQMLGVSRTVTDSEVRDAYFALAKQWHPDRLPPELMLLRPWADRIFHYLTKAKDTLGNEKDRVAYQKSVSAGGGTPESDRHVNAIVQAAMDVQKAEVLVRRNDWDGALDLVAEAKELNPEDADIFALEAYCLFHKQAGNPPHEEILALCNDALALRDDMERALHIKAEVLKRQGDEEGAIKIFRQIIQKNPRHTEAMREIRIYNMRKKSAGGDGGFLSKLFGNKK